MSESGTLTNYYYQERAEVQRFVPRDCRRLLDVGCGGGSFAAAIKRDLGAEVWGVEPHAPAATAAAPHLDRVINGPFDAAARLPEGYFDVVSFNDSLEHFPDPAPPLALARRLLRPGGSVVASIPNVRYIDNVRHLLIDQDWEYTDEGILDRTHLRFFTRKSMLRTFTEAGYRVRSIDGINPHYWSGKRIFLLRLLFGRFVADMKFLQYVVVATPGDGASPPAD